VIVNYHWPRGDSKGYWFESSRGSKHTGQEIQGLELPGKIPDFGVILACCAQVVLAGRARRKRWGAQGFARVSAAPGSLSQEAMPRGMAVLLPWDTWHGENAGCDQDQPGSTWRR
jgi:hypothetical protein